MRVVPVVFVLGCVFAVLEASPLKDSMVAKDYHGEPPLFLTPYLEAGLIKQAQNRSEVHLSGTKVKSYSGLFTVDKTFDSNMFFWYIAPENGDPNAPILVWLQGGPGVSGLYGLFAEFGPWWVDEKLNLIHRDYAWSSKFGLLFIDSPVGTGFSFSRSLKAYTTNQMEVGRDLYATLVQFFTLFPELRKNELYVTGESYAGKYIPTLSHYIHQMNQKPDKKFKINLQGLSIGNGMTDPETMNGYAKYMYEIGFLDLQLRDQIQKLEDKTTQLIKQKKWKEAVVAWHVAMDKLLEVSGLTQFFNFMEPPTNIGEKYYLAWLNQNHIREALHVGSITYKNETTVLKFMYEDMCKSVRPWVVTLLNSGYKVMFYNGQLDIVVAFPLTDNFLQSLDEWKLIDTYRNATRSIWKVDDEVAGYETKVGNLQQVMVRNCGHMVPMDQPKWGLDMIERFVLNKPFH